MRFRECCRRTVCHLWFELPIFVLILVSVLLLCEEAVAILLPSGEKAE